MPIAQVRKHPAPQGTLRPEQVPVEVPFVRSESTQPRRCIKICRDQRTQWRSPSVRKHPAPEGALRLATDAGGHLFHGIRKHPAPLVDRGRKYPAPKGALRRERDLHDVLTYKEAPRTRRQIKTLSAGRLALSNHRSPKSCRTNSGSQMRRQSRAGTSTFWLDVVGGWWLKVLQVPSVRLASGRRKVVK